MKRTLSIIKNLLNSISIRSISSYNKAGIKECFYVNIFTFSVFVISFRKDHFEAVFSYFCSAFFNLLCFVFPTGTILHCNFTLNNVQHLFNGRRTRVCEFICTRLIDIFALVSPLIDKLGHKKFLY